MIPQYLRLKWVFSRCQTVHLFQIGSHLLLLLQKKNSSELVKLVSKINNEAIYCFNHKNFLFQKSFLNLFYVLNITCIYILLVGKIFKLVQCSNFSSLNFWPHIFIGFSSGWKEGILQTKCPFFTLYKVNMSIK